MNQSLSIDDQRLLDSIADQFEQDWTPGNLEQLRQFIDQVDVRLQKELIKSLLETEFELLSKKGMTFFPDDYLALGEHAAEVVKQFAPAVNGNAKVEGSRAHDTDGEEIKQIGPYKLLHQIGEGGMGTVWLAEQERPVRRRVALKLIKNEVGSKEAIARFEAERQALAIMDHQNIAKVLDAGTEESGRPYFVMEMVKGIPITEYCDQNRLNINERLELMASICEAVQHAHQKGIIHRDLKPTNVLVSLYEGKPQPKIIDFGLAKALEHTNKLTDKTMYTEFGKVVGTLQYMSPEQAELNAMDVDTRADVYSLGVLLYELLTGSTPIEKETMKRNLLDLLVYIKESEPPKPSTRLSTSSVEGLSGISEQRKISPARLKSVLRGELDWIVMKALERDRTRRYETASSFGDDIKRYLAGETVSALPPSTVYQVRKFIYRHKGWFSAGLAMFLLLVFGVVGTSIGWIKAENAQKYAEDQQGLADAERTRAVEASERAFEKEREATLLKEIAEQRQRTSEALLAFFQDDLLRLANPWELELAKQDSHEDLSLKEVVDRATAKFSPDNLDPASMDPTAYCAILRGLADIHEGMGNYDKAKVLLQAAFDVAKKEFSESNPVYIEAGINLSFAYLLTAKHEEAVNLFFEIYSILQKVVFDAAQDSESIQKRLLAREIMFTWLNTLKRRTDYRFRTLPIWEPNAASLNKINSFRVLQVRGSLDQFIDILIKDYGGDHEVTLYAMATRGLFDFAFGNYLKAQQQFEHVIAVADKKVELGTMRPEAIGLMGCRQVLAITYGKLKINPELQLKLAETNFEVMKAEFSAAHPATLIAAEFYGSVLSRQEKYELAIEVLKERSLVSDKRFGPTSFQALIALRSYASALWNSGQFAESFQVLDKRLQLVTGDSQNADDVQIHTACLSVYLMGKAAIRQKEYQMAVRCLTRAFEVERKHFQNDWSTFDTQSVLGEALFKKGEVDLAATNLAEGFAGLKRLRNKIPNDESSIYTDAIQRLIGFYEAQDDSESVKKWKLELDSK